MTSFSTTSSATWTTVDSLEPVNAAEVDKPKVQSPRKLEIETGDGLFYLGVVGAKGVGKTALITRYCQNHFPKWYDPVVPNHHSVEVVSQNRCLFEFVELGEESDGHKALDAVILVCDVGDRSSFTALSEMSQRLVRSGTAGDPMALIVNKVDMFQDSREVDTGQARDLAETLGGVFAQCSAREGDGLRDAIQQIMRNAVKARLQFLDQRDLALSQAKEKEMQRVRTEEEEGFYKIHKLTRAKRSMSAKIMSRLSIGKAPST